MDLFTRQGYDRTTVEEISRAAQIGRSTFFRYFSGKEEVVFWDEYDDLLVADLAAQPDATQPIDLVRHVISQVYSLALREAHDSLLARNRLIFSTPSLRSALATWTYEIIDRIAPIVAVKTGRPPDDLQARIAVAAALSAFTEILRHWAAHDGRDDLTALANSGIDVLAAGLRFEQADQSAPLTRGKRSARQR